MQVPPGHSSGGIWAGRHCHKHTGGLASRVLMWEPFPWTPEELGLAFRAQQHGLWNLGSFDGSLSLPADLAQLRRATIWVPK